MWDDAWKLDESHIGFTSAGGPVPGPAPGLRAPFARSATLAPSPALWPEPPRPLDPRRTSGAATRGPRARSPWLRRARLLRRLLSGSLRDRMRERGEWRKQRAESRCQMNGTEPGGSARQPTPLFLPLVSLRSRGTPFAPQPRGATPCGGAAARPAGLAGKGGTPRAQRAPTGEPRARHAQRARAEGKKGRWRRSSRPGARWPGVARAFRGLSGPWTPAGPPVLLRPHRGARAFSPLLGCPRSCLAGAPATSPPVEKHRPAPPSGRICVKTRRCSRVGAPLRRWSGALWEFWALRISVGP